MNPPVDRARRRLLLAAPAAALASGCGIIGGTSGDAGFDVPTPATVAMVDVGQWYCPSPTTAGSYILGRDVDGFYAFTNTCTHQGCPVGCPDPSTGLLTCPCHGSQFNSNGDVMSGAFGAPPSSQASLKHLRVTIDGTGPDATIVVDVTREETDRSARVAPT